MKLLAFPAYLVVRVLTATLRVTQVHPEHIDNTPQYIIAFWHRQLLPILGRSRWRHPINVMTSRSKDGQIIADVLALFGIQSARGSSSRGGSSALREILREAQRGKNIVFTPDGPRGPSGVVKDGVIFAAKSSQLPIVPIAFAVKKSITLRSWDRMIIPKPFSKGICLYGEPFVVPRDGDDEEWRLRLERTLNDLSAQAEKMLEGARMKDEG